jgi:hypothetical protein
MSNEGMAGFWQITPYLPANREMNFPPSAPSAVNSFRCLISFPPQLRFELFHRLNTATAQRRVLRIPANVRLPMPAAGAFLAVGFFYIRKRQGNMTHANSNSRAWGMSRVWSGRKDKIGNRKNYPFAENPKEISSFSPGLRAASYPG